MQNLGFNGASYTYNTGAVVQTGTTLFPIDIQLDRSRLPGQITGDLIVSLSNRTTNHFGRITVSNLQFTFAGGDCNLAIGSSQIKFEASGANGQVDFTMPVEPTDLRVEQKTCQATLFARRMFDRFNETANLTKSFEVLMTGNLEFTMTSPQMDFCHVTNRCDPAKVITGTFTAANQ